MNRIGFHRSCPGKGGRGFTLVELMITVAIIGILASIALPAYNDSVRKGRRAQGRTALLEAMQAQERWFTQRNSYLEILVPGESTNIKMTSGDGSGTPAYRLTAVTCNAATPIASCVKLVAQPTIPDPETGNLTLFSTGLKSCEGASNANACWP